MGNFTVNLCGLWDQILGLSTFFWRKWFLQAQQNTTTSASVGKSIVFKLRCGKIFRMYYTIHLMTEH